MNYDIIGITGAAGYGKRLYPHNGAKFGLPIARFTLLENYQQTLLESGVPTFVVATNNCSYRNSIRQLLPDAVVVDNSEPVIQGNIHAARVKIGDADIVVAGHCDVVIDPSDLLGLIDHVKETGRSAVPYFEDNYCSAEYAVDVSSHCLNRPPQNRKCDTALLPIFVLERKMVDYLLKHPSGDNTCVLFNRLRPYFDPPVDYLRVQGRPFNINYPPDWVSANMALIDRLEIDTPNCNSFVGSRGQDVIIDDSSEVTRSIVLEGSRVGEDCVFDKSVIGKNVVIGNGVVICRTEQNGIGRIFETRSGGEILYGRKDPLGVYIGSNCRIGDGVVLNPGDTIHPSSTVSADGNYYLVHLHTPVRFDKSLNLFPWLVRLPWGGLVYVTDGQKESVLYPNDVDVLIDLAAERHVCSGPHNRLEQLGLVTYGKENSLQLSPFLSQFRVTKVRRSYMGSESDW